MPIARSEVTERDCWDVQSFYPSWEAWEREFAQIQGGEASPRWPELAAFRGSLGQGAEVVRKGLEQALAIERTLERLATYAHLRQDENLANDEHKGRYHQAVALLHDFNQESAWFEPELLALPKEQLDSCLQDPSLADYAFYLERIIRKKPHTLSEQEEELVALSGKALSTPSRAFSMLENADFCFGVVLDSTGAEHELTLGRYATYLRESDRTLRENAFKQLHGQFSAYENTLCELLNGQIQVHIFHARSHGFDSCLEAALFPHAIDPSVYHNLVDTVRSGLPVLHRYLDVRKKLMQLDALHLWDVYTPLQGAGESKRGYDEAVEMVVDSVEPLGNDYQQKLALGLGEERWVDRYENEGKRSGAYSSGCYDSHPYILMNYDGTMRDVLTLAHEAGHSMHSHLSHQNQPYHYSHYPIFVAEVASTFNEELLVRILLDRAVSDEERFAIINQKLEDIRGTFFRQTMFAEFERTIHQLAEEGIPLTPTLLKEKYRELNEAYFGPNTIVDPEIDIEWARIPHFYYNFYVYQYATGISAALALVQKVLEGGKKERDAYLRFLSSGSVNYPIELLKEAGMDMTQPGPIEAVFDRFSSLLDELENLSVASAK